MMTARCTIPNLLTAARIAMAAAAVWLAFGVDAAPVAVAVCIVAALSDACDGWLARSLGQCSRVGKHMDPLADKILMGVVFVWVGIDASSPTVWVLVALMGARDLAMTAFRAYSLRRHGRYIPASRLGRTKMLVQSVVGLTILGVTHWVGRSVPPAVVAGALAAILVISYASAIAYVVDWKREASRAQSKGACRRPGADPLCATQHHG